MIYQKIHIHCQMSGMKNYYNNVTFGTVSNSYFLINKKDENI
jgi:hypothetical protein